MTPPHTGFGAPAPGPDRPSLTAAQRRAVADAEPGTGELHASAATLSRLAALGLARRHGRLGAHYLTAEGRALRETVRGTGTRPSADEPATAQAPEPAASGFSPATGDGPPHPDGARAEAAANAWTSLLEIRRLTGAPADRQPTATPAPWERARPLHAVALALEAGGVPPSAVDAAGRRPRSGFRVTDQGTEPGTVRVEWRTATGPGATGDHPDQAGPQDGRRLRDRDRLDACARILTGRGWETERYTDARRRPYLLVAPRSRT